MEQLQQTTTITTQLLKLVADASVPFDHRFILAVRLLWTARKEQLKPLFPDYSLGHIRNAGTWITDDNYLGRVRESRDTEYLYYLKPKGAAIVEHYTGETDVPSIREQKSTQSLVHEDICTEIFLELYKAYLAGTIELIVFERALTKLEDSTRVDDVNGIEMPYLLKPDIYFLYRIVGKDQTRSFYWEVAHAKSGKDRKTNRPALDVKANAYHTYCEEGKFKKKLLEEFDVEVENTRVGFTFPTEDRANNYNAKLRTIVPHTLGRFWTGSETTYRGNFMGSVFHSPKDSSLHSLLD